MEERALSEDEPVMVAWNAYEQTDDYANTLRWAAHAEHAQGSLWAAYLRGWTDALSGVPDPAAAVEALREIARGTCQVKAMGARACPGCYPCLARRALGLEGGA